MHVTDRQKELIDILKVSDPVLAQCYNLKETRRNILNLGEVKIADPCLTSAFSRLNCVMILLSLN